ncbi:hypothetical protein [Streptomyces sp. NPDC007083]|uniref:hypothetical protein n=1 Tax=Streptomyces sp. NPDC007083 TaxID=3156913 RepID=UPI0033F92B7C
MREHETEAMAEPPATCDGDQIEPQTIEAQKRRRGLTPETSLLLRRLPGLVIAPGVTYGIFRVFFRTDASAPVLAYADRVRHGIDWGAEEPKRTWKAPAAVIIPHIGSITGSSRGGRQYDHGVPACERDDR